MKKEILIQEKKIEYLFQASKKARRIWLTIKPDGSFRVSAPFNMNEETIEEFMQEKKSWILKTLDYFQKNPGIKLEANKEDIHKIKERALTIAQNRIEHFNKIYNFKYRKITIRSQKSRWGSCSQSGNLSFNYKIALLPPDLADYVIVHELCHIKELNHSSRFWLLVEKAYPDHLKARAEFKKIEIKN